MYVLVKKRRPVFQLGGLLSCWDEEHNKTIYGYIIDVKGNDIGGYETIIRWNDIFVAAQYCTETQILKYIKMKLWRYAAPKSGAK